MFSTYHQTSCPTSDCEMEEIEEVEAQSGASVPLLGMLTLGVVACCGLVALRDLSPVWELGVHWSLHYLFIALAILVIAFYRGHWRQVSILSAACCYLGWLTQPWLLLAPITLGPAHGQGGEFSRRARVVSWNVWEANRQFDAVRQWIESEDPDVIALYEVVPEMDAALQWLRTTYPYHLERPAHGGAGIAVYSRIAGSRLRTEDFGWPRQPAVVLELPRDGEGNEPMQLVAMHALSPLPVWRTRIRDQQLTALARWVANQRGPICVCGDLNTTAWTSSFQQLRQAGFRDSRHGSGNWASWPSRLGWAGISIDHALYTPQCLVTGRTVHYNALGSDHFPVLFTLAY
ncbi:MAG: hypothetical protein KatS3mg111_2493 [Pirellulaceae bacterium]|nr:MAG: hypothetical protein KatS3mg111_2493 [Pirellulaceae bacterium]